MSEKGDPNIIKVAVTYQPSIRSYLGGIDIREPISAFISVLCDYWELPNSEQYGLKFSETSKHYICESNKKRIKNGEIMMLVNSVSKDAELVMKKLTSGNESEKDIALQNLVEQSNDSLFANEIIKLEGLTFLMRGIEDDKFDNRLLLPNALHSFLILMDHGFITWSCITPVFIKKVVSYVNAQSQGDPNVTEAALIILENIIINSQENYAIVEKNITLPNVLRRIANSPVEVQQAVLALVNSLLQRSDAVKRKYYFSTLTSRQYRQIITNYIFPIIETNQFTTEMQHQLYVLQHLLLNHYEERLMTSVSPSDIKINALMKEMRLLAFDEKKACGNEAVRLEIKKDFRKLGFTDDNQPENDFESPPGILALDFMLYFARNRTEQYSKIVLENSCRGDSHECPFGRASIKLAKMLADILKINEAPREQGSSFYPMVFTHDHFLEELFCICVVLFNKTWKEMKATQEDFGKVVSVVQDQIARTLKDLPMSLDRFNENINRLTYADISEIWQKERLYHEEREMQAPAIMELKSIIEPEIIQLVNQHRLNFLVNGSVFRHRTQRGSKEKHWYCRLSPNHKYLHCGDSDEKSTPSMDELKNKISVSDIKDFVSGKDCLFKKDKGKKYTELYAFSLILDTGNVNDSNSLDFLTPDESIYNYWLDGLNVLLRRRMTSKLAEQDTNLLLSMELKLRLLDTEGVSIPHEAPPIPPLPQNYDFYYQT